MNARELKQIYLFVMGNKFYAYIAERVNIAPFQGLVVWGYASPKPDGLG